jgi:hypothetical protein
MKSVTHGQTQTASTPRRWLEARSKQAPTRGTGATRKHSLAAKDESPFSGRMVREDAPLETPKQFALGRGLSEGKVRHLINTRQLDHVMIGSRVHIPAGAWQRFLETNTVKACPGETKDHVFVGSRSATASASHGANAVAAASARQAQATATKLKSLSLSSSTLEGNEMAQVIPLNCS